MGVVYEAEDLNLGRHVALSFFLKNLPRTLKPSNVSSEKPAPPRRSIILTSARSMISDSMKPSVTLQCSTWKARP